jgi:formiminoglutamate deiminase
VEAVAGQLYVEMLEAGFTRVGEFHYLHHAKDGGHYADIAEHSVRIAAASGATGIGLTLLPVFYAHSQFGGQAPGEGQRRFINDVSSFGRLLEGAQKAVQTLNHSRVGIAPHSLRAATIEEIRELQALDFDGPIHVHIAEQVKEVEDCLAHTGQRPVEWLFNHAPVNDQWCLVHATHLTPEEAARLAKSDAIAGLCPITEANLGDGLFPARDYLKRGGRFGIGSDSNVLISAAEELRLLEYGQRLIHRERNVLANSSCGESLYVRALDGAQALGVESGIAVGQSADIVSLDCDLDTLIFASARSPIDCVWRFGRKQVEGGRHIKRAAVLADYRKLMQRLAS